MGPVLAFLLAGPLRVTTEPGPQVTEIVRIRPDANDPGWPPVLVFCVLVVVVGGLVSAVVFMRRAREAARNGNAAGRGR